MSEQGRNHLNGIRPRHHGLDGVSAVVNATGHCERAASRVPEEAETHCESCGGYLKTYDGQGNETLLLSDWSSLLLDLIAYDRGLKRLAASLYEFEPVRHP